MTLILYGLHESERSLLNMPTWGESFLFSEREITYRCELGYEYGNLQQSAQCLTQRRSEDSSHLKHLLDQRGAICCWPQRRCVLRIGYGVRVDPTKGYRQQHHPVHHCTLFLVSWMSTIRSTHSYDIHHNLHHHSWLYGLNKTHFIFRNSFRTVFFVKKCIRYKFKELEHSFLKYFKSYY